jgi:hypothetical protein
MSTAKKIKKSLDGMTTAELEQMHKAAKVVEEWTAKLRDLISGMLTPEQDIALSQAQEIAFDKKNQIDRKLKGYDI